MIYDYHFGRGAVYIPAAGKENRVARRLVFDFETDLSVCRFHFNGIRGA